MYMKREKDGAVKGIFYLHFIKFKYLTEKNPKIMN